MPKKTKSNNSLNGVYSQRLKSIRQYVDFNYDLRKPLTKSQKRRISLYFKEIDALTARPFYPYKPKSKAKLKAAQEFAQHEKQLPGLKVAFIPSDGETIPKIRFNKKGELTLQTKHVKTKFLKFDKMKLIKNPVEYVEKIISKAPNAKSFTILAGKYEIPNGYSRGRVAHHVARLTEKYSDEKTNNYFGNWMIGLNAHSFKEQASIEEYRRERRKARLELQAKRRYKKRKNRGDFDNG